MRTNPDVEEWESMTKNDRERLGYCRYYPQTCEHTQDNNGLIPCDYDSCLVALEMEEN